jgi:hypothetical protein
MILAADADTGFNFPSLRGSNVDIWLDICFLHAKL